MIITIIIMIMFIFFLSPKGEQPCCRRSHRSRERGKENKRGAEGPREHKRRLRGRGKAESPGRRRRFAARPLDTEMASPHLMRVFALDQAPNRAEAPVRACTPARSGEPCVTLKRHYSAAADATCIPTADHDLVGGVHVKGQGGIILR